jgi:threonine dehydrogenase-like Zn-dependent dehydrogenase
MPVNLYPMFARELTMHGSRLYTLSAWEEAIRLASSGAVPVGLLVSRRIPLEDLQKGMEEALAGGSARTRTSWWRRPTRRRCGTSC